MFGIDLGITVSSITCISGTSKVIDYDVFYGDKHEKDGWKRIIDMADAIIDSVLDIGRRQRAMIIDPYISIEEPVLPWGTRNPKSYFNMCCLYALVRNKLTVRKYNIYSIHPLSAKATAKRLAFGNKKLKTIYAIRGRLTKKGMMKAYDKVVGNTLEGTLVYKETLADSYFIAHTGLDRIKVGLK